MATKPLLERVALQYLGKLSAQSEVRRDDRAHILDAGERAQMRRVERGAIGRSALAGALSSVVSGAAEVYADGAWPVAAGAPWGARAAYWGFVLGITGIASIFEILFLYWDALRSVHRMAAAAGLPLEVVEAEGVASALARAALELPNPPDPVLGVDPSREASKARLVMVALLYKGKVALTSFILKLLLRRVLTRVLLRTAMLPFVPVPVTAVWNGIVTWLVVREARIRALGPSAVHESLGELMAGVSGDSQAASAMLRAVASSIVRTQSLHPNLHQLLLGVHERVSKASPIHDVDSPALFLEELARLSPNEQRAALRLLSVAAVIDGRTSARERKLVDDASRACGIELRPNELEELRNAFVRGDGFRPEVLASLAPTAQGVPPAARAG